ncbi:MAG: hypothetical protein AAB552_03890 [Patescibacteria group bacterium]
MDIFAHGLWAAAAAKSAKQSRGKRLNVWVTTLWGIFPDLFAFTIPVVWMIWGLTFGGLSLSDMPRHNGPPIEPAQVGGDWTLMLASALYNVSHSLIIFFLVFSIIWFVFRRPVWELGGWLLHILIDVPTHTYQFFPTPVFWPLFDWKFDGFSWGTPWFMLLNYSLLGATFWFLVRRRKRENVSDQS